MNIGLLVIYPKVKWSILPNTAVQNKEADQKIEVKTHLQSKCETLRKSTKKL